MRSDGKVKRLIVPRFDSSLFKNSVKYSAIYVWNYFIGKCKPTDEEGILVFIAKCKDTIVVDRGKITL